MPTLDEFRDYAESLGDQAPVSPSEVPALLSAVIHFLDAGSLTPSPVAPPAPPEPESEETAPAAEAPPAPAPVEQAPATDQTSKPAPASPPPFPPAEPLGEG